MVQNIVAQKVMEAKGKPARYGYIISGKGTEDPTLQMIGYGNMLATQWKNKILRDLEDLKKQVQNDNWHNAAYLIQEDGVLHSQIAMMDEILTDPKLKEAVGSTDSAEASNPPLNTGTVGDRDRTELMKYQKRLDELTNDIKALEASIAKRMDSVNKLNRKDEVRKQQLTKQQGPIIKKIDQLKKKIAASTPGEYQST